MIDYNDFVLLLEKIKNIQSAEAPQITFLDVAGYPHYENVISNILAFLFDTETHGFDDLWIRSLLECYGEKTGKQMDLSDNVVNSIEREAITKRNKRIDLLIETDRYIIIIENKIWSDPYNPFDSYHELGEEYKKNKENLEIVEILLTLKKENNINGFYNITYNDLLNKVRKNIGYYLLNCNEKWLIFMRDFMQDIENLKDGVNMNINKEWNKILGENPETISKLLDEYFIDLNQKMELIESLTKRLDAILAGKYELGSYNTHYNRIAKYSSYASNWINVNYENNILALESYIMKRPTNNDYEYGNYLYIALWNRNDKNYNFIPLINNIKKVYSELEIIEKKTEGWGKHYILKKIDLSEDFDFDEIVRFIIDIVNLLK